MSVSSITPYTTLAELQALQQPFAIGNHAIVTAPTVTEGLAQTAAVPTSPPSNPLVNALNLTLLEYGLTTGVPAAANAPETAFGTNTNSTTPAGDATTGSANSTQATQNFLGALYQAATQTLIETATTTVSENEANNVAAAAAATAANQNTANTVAATTAAATANQNTVSAAAAAAANTAAEAQAAYTGTTFDLTSVLQQIESTPGATATASSNTTQTTENNALATLQANFEDLLNTASDVNSQLAAAANSASPTLQSFVQTLAQNIPAQVTPVSAINPVGNWVETSV